MGFEESTVIALIHTKHLTIGIAAEKWANSSDAITIALDNDYMHARLPTWHVVCFSSLMQLEHITVSLPLLSVAIGFSLMSCGTTLVQKHEGTARHFAMATASTSICLTALGLAFVEFGFLHGTLATAVGTAIALLVGVKTQPGFSLFLSACSFAFYMQSVPA